jgi:hypothetical protein
MAAVSPPGPTFTVTFQATSRMTKDRPRLVARHFGPIIAAACRFACVRRVTRPGRQCDEPIADSAIVGYLISKVIRNAPRSRWVATANELFGVRALPVDLVSGTRAGGFGVARNFVAAASGFLPAGTRS